MESETAGRPARRVLATVLVVLTALLSVVTLLGGYARGNLLSTDAYVAMVAPLARNQAVQADVVDAATAAVVNNVRIDQLTDTALAPLRDSDRRLVRVLSRVLGAVGPLLQNQLEAATRRAAEGVVTSDRFAELWTEANRRGHAAALSTLRDQGSVLRTGDGAVTLDLSVIVAAVQQRLVDDGLRIAALIPPVDRQLVLLRSPELAQAQAALGVADRFGPWLPWLTLAVGAAALVVAPQRRRTVSRLGAGIAITIAVFGVVLVIARGVVLSRVAGTSIETATAAAVVDALLGPLWSQLILVLGLATVLALVAWYVGPGRTRVRRLIADRRSGGMQLAP